MWLFDAGIINFCYNLALPELPLEGNAKSDVFKVYMRDTGLLMAMLEEGSQTDIIDGNLGIYGNTGDGSVIRAQSLCTIKKIFPVNLLN